MRGLRKHEAALLVIGIWKSGTALNATDSASNACIDPNVSCTLFLFHLHPQPKG